MPLSPMTPASPRTLSAELLDMALAFPDGSRNRELLLDAASRTCRKPFTEVKDETDLQPVVDLYLRIMNTLDPEGLPIANLLVAIVHQELRGNLATSSASAA